MTNETAFLLIVSAVILTAGMFVSYMERKGRR